MAEEKPAVTEEKPPAKEKPAAENVVFIGIKPVMNYVLAVITQFNQGVGDVTLKARGKAISRAVDVAEIVRNRFLQGLGVKNILIGTEEVQGERGAANVSTIEIVLGRGK
ncbi:MAG: DNA-binding protein Alba [Candidatus Hadarchaeaceae archaeon]